MSLALTDQEVPIQHLEMPPPMSPEEAAAVLESDPRYEQRPTEREDRGEALLTSLLQRNGGHWQWISVFERAPDGEIVMGEVKKSRAANFPLFDPAIKVWDSWGGAEAG